MGTSLASNTDMCRAFTIGLAVVAFARWFGLSVERLDLRQLS
jgi:hypothetical protein